MQKQNTLNLSEQEINEIIGTNIGRIRQRKGQKKTELSQEIKKVSNGTTKISATKIGRYEMGKNKISADNLLFIAAALKEPVEKFFQMAPDNSDINFTNKHESERVTNLIKNYLALADDWKQPFDEFVKNAPKKSKKTPETDSAE